MKLIVKFNNVDDGYVNISADEILEDAGFIKAYIGNELIGMFRAEEIKMIYKSGGK